MTANTPINRVRIALVLTLIAILALGSFWLLEVMRRSGDETPQKPGADASDYTVDQFTFLRLSEQGQIRYELSGDTLTHYLNDTYKIAAPVVHALSAHAAPVVMKAKNALVDDVARKIHMYHDVKLDRAAQGKSERLHVNSEYLMILPDDNIIKTDKPVEIELGRSRLTGVGMFVNNTTLEFQLFDNVHGTFLSPAR